MRFMVLMMGDERSESGVLPTERELTEMGRYNEELAKAGVLLTGEGLHPTSKGKKVKFAGGRPTVIDGPFTEAKEMVAGFWLIDVKSKEEAVEWVKRIPCIDGTPFHVEIRRGFEAADFGAAYTEEQRARDAELRRLEAERR